MNDRTACASWTIGGPNIAYGGRRLNIRNEGRGVTVILDQRTGRVSVEAGSEDSPLTPLETNMSKHWAATMNCKRRSLWRRGFFGDDRKIRRRA